MKDTTWVTDILLDIARFSEENGLPKTYDSLISVIKVAANELKQKEGLPQSKESNVVWLFESRPMTFTIS
jgi:hypothetical protein